MKRLLALLASRSIWRRAYRYAAHYRIWCGGGYPDWMRGRCLDESPMMGDAMKMHVRRLMRFERKWDGFNKKT